MKSRPFLGIGLRSPHYKQISEYKSKIPEVDWLEVHSENFFHRDSYALDLLLNLRKDYQISLHGVGLSLGSAEDIYLEDLIKIKELVEIIDPFLISEHLSWSRVHGYYLPDLLPIPYCKEATDIFVRNIIRVQDFLGRQILIENPSTYLEYKHSDISEVEFIKTIVERSGCKILLDITNLYVSCFNHHWQSKNYLDSLNKTLIEEIHLAGHSSKQILTNNTQSLKKLQTTETTEIKIDTHNNFVSNEVWQLYKYACTKFGQLPTLLEWDKNIPNNIEILVQEIKKAKQFVIS